MKLRTTPAHFRNVSRRRGRVKVFNCRVTFVTIASTQAWVISQTLQDCFGNSWGYITKEITSEVSMKCLSGLSLQRLGQVVYQILNVLAAHTHTDKPVRNEVAAPSCPALGGGVDAAEAGGFGDQLG